MKTEFTTSFAKDLRSIKDKNLRLRILELIEFVERASSLDAIPNLKKLRNSSNYYRVRLGAYRVGITIRGSTVSFVRCLHRKEIYRYFP